MNLHRLDLVSLSLFGLVVRTGSISRGAELAHLAVGAASKRISDLEAAVGAELLERHSRGVTLTLAGQALHRHAQRILADVDQLADLSDHASGIVGVVRLVAKPIVAQLQAAVAKALDSADAKDKLAAVGCEPFKASPEQFAALIRDDLPKWAKIVKDSGATVD